MKFATEKDSIDYFVKRLEDKGWTNVSSTQSTDQYSYYDVEGTYNGKVYRFELKRRNYDSDHFGDAICEKWKFDHFIEDMRKGDFYEGYLVSMFNDKITIDNISYPYDIDFVYANKTTEFNNRNIVQKTMCHYKQEYKRDYNY